MQALPIVIRKYGGTSLSRVEDLARIARDLGSGHGRDARYVVVVSAMGGTTDALLAKAEEVRRTVKAREEALSDIGREIDQLLATGETASAALLALALNTSGVRAVSLTAEQAGISATDTWGCALITDIDTARIRGVLASGAIPVVTGFQAVSPAGDTVTLGRGGSDTTAVALAVSLQAKRCEILTDVDGVYTADPRVVPTARLLDRIGAELMAEYAWAGARVMHARAIELAARHGTDVVVRNSFVDNPGTLIGGGGETEMLEANNAVIGVAYDTDMAEVTIRTGKLDRHTPTRLLRELADRRVLFDLLSGAGSGDRGNLRLLVKQGYVPILEAVAQYLSLCLETDVTVSRGLATVSVVGVGFMSQPGYAATALATMHSAGIAVVHVSVTQSRITLVVPADSTRRAVASLHSAFALDVKEEDSSDPVLAGHA